MRRIADGDEHVIELPDPVYTVWAGENLDYDTTTMRYGYTSLVAPDSAFDYDLETRASTLVKQTPVLGGYDPASTRRRACGRPRPDGTQVPMSVVHRKDVAARRHRARAALRLRLLRDPDRPDVLVRSG